ncbi:flagellar biosynthesis anti-sigma factor FlgM [uncultured Pseudoflavonifractor sp.]|uniref:flagellar biosynthesis anti-sigma factor FlgM n=1 Tax=uncultured Pseudoflavonifractor sp. TaxID=1221379 RepID=UPI0025DC3624|nr:flagellar biosynthesis anti-sigma factor FlgM [uncultured Pseudoflavonifractor sp.]
MGEGYPVIGPTAYGKKTDAASVASPAQQYDQVQFSSHMDMAEKRMKETVSRLSQEVRTRVTAQDVEHLQQQVAAGEYQPSPREIAARMLLLREDG